MGLKLEEFYPAIESEGINTNKSITIGGAANCDMSGSTGFFKLPAGAISFSGNIALAANETITAAAGSGSLDMSLATGTFLTSTCVNTIGGNLVVPLASSKTFDFSNYSGSFNTSTRTTTLIRATVFAAHK